MGGCLSRYLKQVLTGLLSTYAVEWIYENRFRGCRGGCRVCRMGCMRDVRWDTLFMGLLSSYA